MTKERAFGEAVATVAIPSLLIWGVLLYVIPADVTADAWPLYIVFVALPLPLVFPIYRRYLRGSTAKVESPRSLFLAGAVSTVLGLAYVVFTLIRHRDNFDMVFHLVIGVGWLLIGAEKFRRGIRASKQPPQIRA